MASTKVRSSTQLNIDTNLDAQTHKVINVVDPTAAQDAATKNYVDTTAITTASFVFNETPSGTVDGSNASFTLAFTPVSGKQSVHLNGIKQKPGAGNDYTISGAVITFTTPPAIGDLILVDYIK